MKLFTVGPVQMHEKTLQVAIEQTPYFRTAEFSDIMFDIESKMKKIIYTKDSSKVVTITGSGTAAMESVIMSSFDSEDKLLIVNGGSFGKRFCELCKIHNINYDEIKLEFEESLSVSHLEKIDGSKYTAFLVNIHETSTGQLYDINIIKEFCKKYNLYLVVDAISSFMSDEYKMDENNIDCTIVSSQKGLALNPGLSFVIINDRFYEEKIKNKPKKSLYLDLNEHIENMKRGQTPFTPAVGILLELSQRLSYVYNYGIDNIVKDTNKLAVYFRELINKSNLNIRIPNYKLSNTLTPLYFENENAKKVFETLKNDYDTFVTPSGGLLENKLLRVGHIGNLNQKDFDELIEKIEVVTKL